MGGLSPIQITTARQAAAATLRLKMQRKGTAVLALVAMALTWAALWYHQRPVISKESTWADVEAEARNGGYRLLKTDELAELYRQGPEKLLLVDTRQEWEYLTGHIPGARNFPMEPTRWARWRSRGALLKFLGPDQHRTIVFY
jgi:3-mercaptopyruvate sulfurtransferase SseA